MKISNTNTAASSKDTADPPPSKDNRPEHSSPTSENAIAPPLVERKQDDVVEDHDPQEQPMPKQKESPSSGNKDIDNRAVSPHNRKDSTLSDDIFLDNIPITMDNRKDIEIEMEMSTGDEPPMAKKPAKVDMNDDDATPGDCKTQSSTMIYDLGASPSPTTKLPTKISTTAQKLLGRIPPLSHKKKSSAAKSNQVHKNADLRSSRNKSTMDNKMSNKNKDGAEDERNNASNCRVHISVEEFHAQKMKMQEMEENHNKMIRDMNENYDRRIQDLESNYSRRIRDLDENYGRRIQDMEANYDRRFQDLEESRDSRTQELESLQQEMQSLLDDAEVPQGAADDEEATRPTLLGEQQNDNPNMRRSSIFSNFKHHGTLFRPARRHKKKKTAIENDTFSLMMISKVWSRSWALGLIAFLFQIALEAMIASDQVSLSTASSIFDVPFMVDPVVRVGQLFAIILCLATQSDILTSVQSILLLRPGSDWDVVIGERGNKSTRLWIIRILLPNLLKFTQGVLVMFVCFVIIVQSYDIIDLLKDFTALMVLAETDNILFHLASYGYLGQTLMEQTNKVLVTAVPTASANATDTPVNEGRQPKLFCIRISVLLCLFAPMLGGWLYIVIGQSNGKFFRAKYPKCNFTDAFQQAKEHFGDGVCYGGRLNTLDCAFEGGDCVNFNLAFPLCKGDDLFDVEKRVGNQKCNNELNKIECDFDGGDCDFESRYPNCPHIDLAEKHFGDGTCYGGSLNTLGCAFEGGDCVNFNLAFPLCKGADRTDVQTRVGDGTCDEVFMSFDCDYDGGDCCPYEIMDDPSFGDGICDEKANTEKCGYDNGDCVDYNRDYSGCPLNIVFGNPSFGDGQWCNGGIASTENCSYDDEDCDEFRLAYPDCPLDDLSRVEGANDTVLGDGICDSGIYNLKECGYENGDCNHGQIGQPLSLTGDVYFFELLFFSKVLSLDGTTIAVGLQGVDEDGNSRGSNAPGMVKIWRYNTIRKKWFRLGNDIVGQQNRDFSGSPMSLSANGNRIMISSASGVRIYDYNITRDTWIQVGDTITASLPVHSFYAMMTNDGSKVASRYSENEIRVRDIDGSSEHDIINPRFNLKSSPIVQLTFNTKDGSRLLVSSHTATKVYQYQSNPNTTPNSWTQIGQDFKSLPSDSYSLPSSAISADGNRIALSSNTTSSSRLGQVKVFDYDGVNNTWVPVGDPIKSRSLSNGYGFGYDIEMSSDGNLLVIASNGPYCQPYPNRFNSTLCTTGSIEVYNYNPDTDRFQNVLPNPASPFKVDGNTIYLTDLVSESAIFGLHFSINGNGTVLSISGVDDGSVFVEVYDLDNLFYTKCTVESPESIGNGECDYKYNTTECGFDGGDCIPTQVEDYLGCLILPHHHDLIGDGRCDDYPPYNSEECGYDGGDCERNSVDGNPLCFVHYTDSIGNGYCDDEYNTTECGYDGGDCIPAPVEGYPDCIIFTEHHDRIGDGWCDYNYNITECGYDGGDCIPKPVKDYSNCIIPEGDHSYIGDGWCDDCPPYNSKECGYDGGDCERNPVEKYPDCFVHYTYMIGNGWCDDWYNSKECGYDGGDCERNPVEGHPDCFVHHTDSIGDGFCADYPPYNSKECGFDGGDCIRTPVEGYPDCLLLPGRHSYIGNGWCDDDSLFNTTECGFDGGDCIPSPVERYPECVIPSSLHDRIGDGRCDIDYNTWEYVYNTTECGFDGGDCISKPVEGYPECVIPSSLHDRIGNGKCDIDYYTTEYIYNTTECGFDGGDCISKPVEGYPECVIPSSLHDRIGDGRCDIDYYIREYYDYYTTEYVFNTTECGFDGGDCIS